MSVRADKPTNPSTDAAAILNNASATDSNLGEGNSYCVASPDNPLKRNLVVSIRASLNDLCLSKSKGTWQPSSDALKSICKLRHLLTKSHVSSTLLNLTHTQPM
tara:strand:+ start:85 stop:396 length:312 start_codon:yes stop_codon:yes gene_type:complete